MSTHNRSHHRRALLRGGMALGASLLLPQARACEFFAATLRILHPWTRATHEGDSSVVLCMKFDEVTSADRLVAVRTPLATGARMGGPGAAPRVDFAIPKGANLEFTEQGTHVLLTGLTQTIEVGRAYPLDLVFEKGGTVKAQFEVDYPPLARDHEGHESHGHAAGHAEHS